jgi:CheY-like chemotaxis protein
MNAVLGMTNLLLETDLSDEQKDYAMTVRSSGEALLCIINDILDFSKMEAGKMVIEPIPFDLVVTVEDVVELLGGRASEKGVELIFGCSQIIPRRVIGDPGRIRQILMNLGGNAIKFTKQGYVSISIHCDNPDSGQPTFRFSVKDTGIGVAVEKLPVLFEKFTQADASTTRTFGGTGLGLAISKQLVELMGGQIQASSQLGEGSTFSFSLPLVVDVRPPASHIMSSNLQGARVLVVDDNPINLQIVTEQLVASGGEVACASSAAESLAILRGARENDRPFHLAILDSRLPDSDGESLGRVIKSDKQLSELSLLMLTSAAQKTDAARFQSLGFSGYLVKPARSAVLQQAVLTLWGAILSGIPIDRIVTRHSLAEARIRHLPSAVEQPERVLQVSSRVLVAEDNIVNQKLARRLLEKAGCAVDVVSNGCEAIDMWEQFPYDLIFMDCQMPEMDGYSATAEIRRREQGKAPLHHTPIVALTANAMSGDREKCLSAGMDDFLSKPIPFDALNLVLRRWAAPFTKK